MAIDYVGGALSTGGWCCSSQQQQQQQLSIAPADDDHGSSVESRCCLLHQRIQMVMILGGSVGKLTANSGAWAPAKVFTRGHSDGSQLCSVNIIRGSQPILNGRSPDGACGAAAEIYMSDSPQEESTVSLNSYVSYPCSWAWSYRRSTHRWWGVVCRPCAGLGLHTRFDTRANRHGSLGINLYSYSA